MAAGKEFEGKDLDDALKAASKALGSRPQEIDYELLAEGRRGVFGIGARNVRIWVNLPDGDPGVPAALEGRYSRAPSDETARWADDKLRSILDAMGFEVATIVTSADEGARIEIRGSDAARIVANDGELLEALQFLLNRTARQAFPDAGRIQLECEGYRDRRDRELVERARQAAREVARTGAPRSFSSMNAYERRLIHIAVRDVAGVVSRSEGTGSLKDVRVELAKARGEA